MVDHCAHRWTESRVEEQDLFANVSDFYLMLLITDIVDIYQGHVWPNCGWQFFQRILRRVSEGYRTTVPRLAQKCVRYVNQVVEIDIF